MARDIALRSVEDSDLPFFFAYQQDPAAVRLAAVAARDAAVFAAHWAKIRADETTVLRTIVLDRQVAGYVVSFDITGHREVGYWIGRSFWGQGVASAALATFLGIEIRRPIFGHVAKHNGASKRVLEKCGFVLDGDDPAFATVNGEAIEGYIMRLG